MKLHRTDDARPLGDGFRTQLGAVTDADLARVVANYKRVIASNYEALAVDELPTALPPGPYLVSPKIDGQLWYLVLDDSDAILVNPRGRVLFGALPVLDEARKNVAPRAQGRTVLAGELWAVPEAGRVRSAGLASALSGEASADVKRVAFTAFDLVWGSDAEAPKPPSDYHDRLAVLQRLTEGGKRLRTVATETLPSLREVAAQYQQHVSGGRAEGLVVRARNTKTYKVKPVIAIDAAIIGYTNKADEPDQARSLLMALMRDDGSFQVIGSVGNMGDVAQRQAILARVQPLACESNYRHASRDGVLYRMVRPELVVQFRINDVQSTDPAGAPVQRMVLSFDDGSWKAIARMPGVAIYHPIFEQFREDKGINPTDLRMAQVLDRCYVSRLDTTPAAPDLPASTLLARRVFAKDAKGSLSVRKILAWKTNKEAADPRFPAYVVHYTDYSATRKVPLQRTVRCAPTLDEAMRQLDAVLADKKVVKDGKLTRGWEEVEGRRVDWA